MTAALRCADPAPGNPTRQWSTRISSLFSFDSPPFVDGTEVHPREVVKQALISNAAAVIVAHNHPSGVPDPSTADRALTERLKQALSLVEVRLLDHFVIGGRVPLSMAARG